MPTVKEGRCIYECNKGIKCECADCNLCEHNPKLHGERKTYSEEVMQAIRQRRGLEPDDTSKDDIIMNTAKQDIFNEYCQYNGLLGGYGYALLNVIEDIYGINLQQ